MAQEIKYTNDGKKVVVIGSLNSTDKIVQEIFTVDGSEIPSGEHFVVKSLHDAPAVSWKEQELKKLEERYERERKRFSDETDSLIRKGNDRNNLLREKLEYTGKVLKEVSPNSFDMIVKFLTGKIKWVVMENYSPQLIELNLKGSDSYYDKIRLLSIFGKDDGTLTYATGQYSDYSGGYTKVVPFENYEEAFEYFKNFVISKGATDETLKIAKQYKFDFPADAIAVYKEKRTKDYNGYIENKKKEISDCEKKLTELETL